MRGGAMSVAWTEASGKYPFAQDIASAAFRLETAMGLAAKMRKKRKKFKMKHQAPGN